MVPKLNRPESTFAIIRINLSMLLIAAHAAHDPASPLDGADVTFVRRSQDVLSCLLYLIII